ncbi:MAG: hypothetical protein J6B39_07840 [Lachnospiraceae bacterium]|nr:hypothetical protein [Lachnospiraceae bacterium]
MSAIGGIGTYGMGMSFGYGGRYVSSLEERAMKRSGQIQCEECASRKYKDGSNEMDVSFKAPGHISPQASAGAVAAHEQQHVANAYQKAAKNGGEVLHASVTLKRAICSECGRSYVSGGTTSTMIKYTEENPYSRNAKSFDQAAGILGQFVDYAV